MDILGLIEINGWILVVIFLCVTIIIIFVHFRSKHTVWSRAGVPGPTSKPFVGITPLYRTKGMIQTDLDLVKKYGRCFGIYQGLVPTLVISDPETIKEVMVKEFSNCPNRRNVLPSRNELKHSLIHLRDDHWRFIRNTLLPTFSSGKMRALNPIFKRSYEQLVENLKPKAEAGEPIEFKQVFGAYTMDIIASAGFGLDVDSQKNPENKFTKYAKMLFDFKFSRLIILIMAFPSVDIIFNWFNISPNNNRTIMDFFKSVVKTAIGMRNETDQKPKDLLQMMLNAHNDKDVNDYEAVHQYEKDPEKWKKRGLTLDEITGNAILFLLVGYDTTASALTFVTYCLATNPDCQEKLIKEIDSVLGKDCPNYDNIQKMDYLDRVFSETLRLYAPGGRTGRNVEKEMIVNGYKIPKNAEIMIPIHAIHRDPEFWEEPDKFDPERFTPENKAKRHPYCYLPFGHGPRSCIGMRLAQVEAKYALVYILQHYRFKTCAETEIPLQLTKGGITKPANGMKLKLESRV
ncbi:cytochrome P450 3A6-like isoform X1 [Mytilus trossulus]|uniref:cytochrome P450 3A6-like isoform X1 n=1 Tax=Mytilus trossulus TaxID=6551 RepID=UPI00300520BE